ncbi:ABC transporter ATP-binding protein [Afifella sp. IM 167]|uniref:ABC transporter ATP-binding protein n=1 Tax=Afifella sp. IM 167 TaxID=2033586 RepID=UPI001CCBD01A|nr:ABC transporter ATP-binding protein [Afifella sp. IM 167]MBZ8134780.1 mannosyltransferase [Afifella sp. IM 167]
MPETNGSPTESAIHFQDLTVRFATPAGDIHTVVEDITLDIDDGSFVAVVGPSGCGKSTLLNVAAGLLVPPKGNVLIFNEPLQGINKHAAYLFQQDALLPWRTVLENVRLGLTFRGVGYAEATDEAEKWIARVGLAGFEDRFPYQLSGGMRKRVAIAQSWIVDPRILLMDEPFSALDIQTRQNMENELLSLWLENRKTVLFITHDLEEAIALADKVVVLSAGPAHLKGVYDVDLERPRDVIEIRMDPKFTRLYQQIWADLRDEVKRSYDESR